MIMDKVLVTVFLVPLTSMYVLALLHIFNLK